MTSHTYTGIATYTSGQGWEVKVEKVSHKRHTLIGIGSTRDAAIKDVKTAMARLLGVNTADLNLTVHNES
jgi:hypothetical protein